MSKCYIPYGLKVVDCRWNYLCKLCNYGYIDKNEKCCICSYGSDDYNFNISDCFENVIQSNVGSFLGSINYTYRGNELYYRVVKLLIISIDNRADSDTVELMKQFIDYIFDCKIIRY